MSKNRGYSLIETAVVVTVLLTTGTVAFASLNDSQTTNRDAKRREDVLALQQAYESYFDEYDKYDSDCTKMSSDFLRDSHPSDPLLGEREYVEHCAEESYGVCANLERQGSGNSNSAVCDFDSGVNKVWLCVENA